ncbi:MAG: DUF4296 domain-containing protein [Sphingobacteriales bacterium]|nr:MAG: DUF4296 domain-containing protein [Sphingobacteriales bacterium]
MRWLMIAVFSFAFASCIDSRQKKPKNLLEFTPMTAVLADVLTADAVANERKYHDSLLNVNNLSAAYYQQIFKLHNISKEQFTASYEYYVNHPDEFKIVLDSVSTIINRRMSPANHSTTAGPGSQETNKSQTTLPQLKPKIKNPK